MGGTETLDQSNRLYEKAVVVSAEVAEVSDKYGSRKGQALKLRLTTGPESGKIVEFRCFAPGAFTGIHDSLDDNT
jgi:hypothetical protein